MKEAIVGGLILAALKGFRRWIINKWRLFWRTIQNKKEEREYAKQQSDLKNELWNHIQDLKLLFNFNSDNGISFYNVLKRAKMDNEKLLLKICILEKWFFYFCKRFSDSNNLKILVDELIDIIDNWELIYKAFCNELKEEKLPKKSWIQLKENYNGTIKQLESFFRNVQGELGIEFHKFLRLAENPKSDSSKTL